MLLDSCGVVATFDFMEVHLTPEEKARVAELAARNGRSAEEVVHEALTRYLADEARFAEAIRLGLAAADKGDFLASEEVWAAVERTLQS